MMKELKNLEISLKLALWIHGHCEPHSLPDNLYYLLPDKEKIWTVEELYEHYKKLEDEQTDKKSTL